MDTVRRQELKGSLERELELESIRNRFTSLQRVRWLSSQLQEYVERWLGFCAITDAPMSALINSALFGMIEIGAEALQAELTKSEVPAHVGERWSSFYTCLRVTTVQEDKLQTQNLRQAMLDLHTALQTI